MTEQQQVSDDGVMTRIGQALMLLHGGDREEARNRFGLLWQQIGPDGDPCTAAPSRTTWRTPRTTPRPSWPGTCGR